MFHLIIFLSYALELFFQWICCDKFLTRKNHNIKTKIASGIIPHSVAIGLYFLFYYLDIPISFYLNLVTYFIAFILFYIVNYKCKLFKCILTSVICVLVMAYSETIALYLIDLVYKKHIAYSTGIDLILVTVLAKLLYFLVMALTMFLFNKFDNIRFDKHAIPYIIIATISSFSGMFLAKASFDWNIPKNYTTVFLIFAILVVFANLYYTIIYFRSQKQQEELHLLQTEKLQYQLDNTYLKLLENQNEEMHILAHDIKNHLSTIGAMNNIDDVQNYVHTVYNDYTSINLAKSSNKMIDIILYKYSMICKGHNVDFVIEAKTANLSYIEESQLSSLLNNLLDNAVEAAKNSKDKFVEMAIRKEHNFDVLTVINSCDSQPDLTKSTKHDFKNHGYGTKIIKRIVSKNNGEFDCRFDSENSKFIITIIFPNKQGE